MLCKIKESYKNHTCRFPLMVLCDKCYHEKHDQCMGKAGMFDCECKCYKS